MAYLPRQNEEQSQLMYTQQFLGYNHTLSAGDGETWDEENMSSRWYPAMSPRPGRSVVMELTDPVGILGKDALCVIADGKVYYGGMQVQGLTVSMEESMLPKQLVSMGAYLCIWPDKKYLNTVDLSDYGSMDAHYQTLDGTNTTVQMCRLDGTSYDELGRAIVVSADPPSTPARGMLWIDSSESAHVLMQYSGETWIQVATTYLKISAPGLGASFREYDTVTLSGFGDAADALVDEDTGISQEVADQIRFLDGDMIVYAAGEDYIVVAGIVDQSVTLEDPVKADRDVPDLDYITESNNRLWGCRYGMADGQVLNEIKACKLGDFRNWNSYMGLATDSYTVSVGSDGVFTGACTLRGYPTFFKEGCVHRIGGTQPSSYTLTTTVLRGVQKGSERSMVIVGETLYYKGRTDILAYDGSLPSAVSLPLGTERYHGAVAGAFGGKYYISMADEADAWHLFVWDTVRGCWHREDGLHAVMFAQQDDSLYCIDADTGRLLDLNGVEGTREEDFAWKAVMAVTGYEAPFRKYLRRYNLRMILEPETRVQLWIQYDSSGKWEFQQEITGMKTATHMIPVVPHRCDHCQVMLTGHGDAKILSVSRIYEAGSDG